jgi:hypothetical protein
MPPAAPAPPGCSPRPGAGIWPPWLYPLLMANRHCSAHRDVFGDLVFPLQVVVGLDEYGTPSASSSTTPEPGRAVDLLPDGG